MVQFTAFRRSLRFSTLAVCSAAIVSLATPASARSHHGAGHHARGHHSHRHFKRHSVTRHFSRRFARAGSDTALMRLQRFANANASIAPQNSASSSLRSSSLGSSSLGSSNVVAEARRYLGGNPTGRSRLWCARFMNLVLERSGYKGTGSDMARSFASYGHRVSGPQIGAIAVMARRGGGHVGVVSGIDSNGNPILVSGNNGHRVREAAYPRGRIYAYVMPTS
jgi:uncharacterized protein (TIGR02594 family)